MLGKVGVLVLIDEYVAEHLRIVAADLRMLLKQQVGVDEHIVKVHHAALPASLPIGFVEHPHGRLARDAVILGQTCVIHIFCRRNQAVLGVGYARKHIGRLVLLVVAQPLFLEQRLDETARVGVVVDGEVAREAYQLMLGLQDAHEHRVERTHPQAACQVAADHGGNPFLHLVGRFLGECERKDG